MKIKTDPNDFSKVLLKYSNTWLAFKPDSTIVIASGKDPKTVLEKSWNKGIDSPVLMRAPKNFGTYIL